MNKIIRKVMSILKDKKNLYYICRSFKGTENGKMH